jgi:hypothetical protein
MARRKMEHRIMKIVEPKDKDGLVIIHYQTYVGNMPSGDPWEDHLNQEDYKVLSMKWILLREFEVPEHFIDKFESAVRDAKERDDMFDEW